MGEDFSCQTRRSSAACWQFARIAREAPPRRRTPEPGTWCFSLIKPHTAAHRLKHGPVCRIAVLSPLRIPFSSPHIISGFVEASLGGAGAVPRQMRPAISLPRCLPHPRVGTYLSSIAAINMCPYVLLPYIPSKKVLRFLQYWLRLYFIPAQIKPEIQKNAERIEFVHGQHFY